MSGTAKPSNVKFDTQIDCKQYYQNAKKINQRGAWTKSITCFQNFAYTLSF